MRRERIEFSLTVLRKMFVYHANQDGVSFFTGLNLKVCETQNKNQHWLTCFVFIRGNLGSVLLVPVSPAKIFYVTPQVGGTDKLLCVYLAGKNFEVKFLRRGLASLLPVLPGEASQSEAAVLPHTALASATISSLSTAVAGAITSREDVLTRAAALGRGAATTAYFSTSSSSSEGATGGDGDVRYGGVADGGGSGYGLRHALHRHGASDAGDECGEEDCKKGERVLG
ncbi:hypothetical protein KSP39_PZI001018 [Platanthera zijinensis]|uniref:Uncharacterized protein n=1 Tax=Platanthera zijinensis TaxID=2320716 RepID=A0AAP0GEW0_9ASPA